MRGVFFHALIFQHGVKQTKWHHYFELVLHNLISVTFGIENIFDISFENLPLIQKLEFRKIIQHREFSYDYPCSVQQFTLSLSSLCDQKFTLSLSVYIKIRSLCHCPVYVINNSLCHCPVYVTNSSPCHCPVYVTNSSLSHCPVYITISLLCHCPVYVTNSSICHCQSI